jgi:hypothetical protein
MAIWYILWSFGIFSPFWFVVPRLIWQSWTKPEFVILRQFGNNEQQTGPACPLLFVFAGVNFWYDRGLLKMNGVLCAAFHSFEYSRTALKPGLPDFSWHNIPKRGKSTKLPLK